MGLQKCQKAYSKIEKNYGVICVNASTKIKIILIILCPNIVKKQLFENENKISSTLRMNPWLL